jgi:glycolate oxidase iron-sulfur subunit
MINPSKVINFGNLIALKNYKFKFKKPIKVTFHKPCHLQNDIFMTKIFENCENVEYIPMENYDDCCGFAGSFAIKNHKYSLQLSKQKAQYIKNTKADYVITTCPACILGLKQGMLLTGGRTKVISLLEFLAMGINE